MNNAQVISKSDLTQKIQNELLDQFEGYLKYQIFKYLSTYSSFSLVSNYDKKIEQEFGKIQQTTMFLNDNFDIINKDTNFLYFSIDKSINIIPTNFKLIILHLGISFTSPIDKLPSNLKVLILPNFYNHKITFPDSIEYLELSQNYNHDLDKLPSNLKVLTINCIAISNPQQDLNKFALDNLPFSLISLNISTDYLMNFDNLPPNLKYLRINMTTSSYVSINISNLPNNLEFLEIINVDSIDDLITLPQSLSIIKIGFYNSKIYYYQKNKIIENVYQNLINKFYKLKPNIKFILDFLDIS